MYIHFLGNNISIGSGIHCKACVIRKTGHGNIGKLDQSGILTLKLSINLMVDLVCLAPTVVSAPFGGGLLPCPVLPYGGPCSHLECFQATRR